MIITTPILVSAPVSPVPAVDYCMAAKVPSIH